MGMLLYMEEQRRLAAMRQKKPVPVEEEIPFTDPEEPVPEAETTAEQEKPEKKVTRKSTVRKPATVTRRRKPAK